MTHAEAIAFLRAHQPMPSDWDITDQQCASYLEAIDHFTAHPDPVCIPLFLGSLSNTTGLGMYKSLNQVFDQFTTPQLVPHLIDALKGNQAGQRYWATHYATDYPHVALIDPLKALLESPEDADAHYFSVLALDEIGRETKDSLPLAIIQQHAHIPHDEQTRELIQEIMARIA